MRKEHQAIQTEQTTIGTTKCAEHRKAFLKAKRMTNNTTRDTREDQSQS